MQEEKKYECEVLPQSCRFCYSSPLPDPEKCTRQVADQDNVIDSADDAVRDLESLEVLELEELVIDLADHDDLQSSCCQHR